MSRRIIVDIAGTWIPFTVDGYIIDVPVTGKKTIEFDEMYWYADTEYQLFNDYLNNNDNLSGMIYEAIEKYLQEDFEQSQIE